MGAGEVTHGVRDYDVSVGRWTAKDPIRFGGGINLFLYANGDPVNFFDPNGELVITTTVIVVAAVATVATAVVIGAIVNANADNITDIAGDIMCRDSDDAPPNGCVPSGRQARPWDADCDVCVYDCPGYGAPVTFPQEKGLPCMGVGSDGWIDTSQIGPRCRY
jgi:hypothetical protein